MTESIVDLVLVIASVAWILNAVAAVRATRTMPTPHDHEVTDTDVPSLSVILTACNEGETIGHALELMLRQEHPDVEFVVVDDRSTDATGRIIDAVAQRDPRVKPLHIEQLPSGWLGKVHAMHRGQEYASGEWLLFMDADVHLTPDALRIAANYATSQRLDMLCLLPEPAGQYSLPLAVCVAAFGHQFMAAVQPWKVNAKPSRKFAGVGAFNLVRRDILERTEGLEWLRMDVADDLSLGYLMYRAGAQMEVGYGVGLLSMAWYGSVDELVRGIEKNLFGTMAQYRYALVIPLTVFLLLQAVAPVIGLVIATADWVQAVCAVAIVMHSVSAGVLSRFLRRGYASTLLAPVGQFVIAWALVRSALACWRNGGIVWRGTTYPVEALREGQRVTWRALIAPERVTRAADATGSRT